MGRKQSANFAKDIESSGSEDGQSEKNVLDKNCVNDLTDVKEHKGYLNSNNFRMRMDQYVSMIKMQKLERDLIEQTFLRLFYCSRYSCAAIIPMIDKNAELVKNFRKLKSSKESVDNIIAPLQSVDIVNNENFYIFINRIYAVDKWK